MLRLEREKLDTQLASSYPPDDGQIHEDGRFLARHLQAQLQIGGHRHDVPTLDAATPRAQVDTRPFACADGDE